MRAGGERPWSNDGTLCGIYYAIVSQNKDEELKQARIKVRFQIGRASCRERV